MVEQTQKIKVLRMRFSIMVNVRMLRGIILKLPRASQVPDNAKLRMFFKTTFFFDICQRFHLGAIALE